LKLGRTWKNGNVSQFSSAFATKYSKIIILITKNYTHFSSALQKHTFFKNYNFCANNVDRFVL